MLINNSKWYNKEILENNVFKINSDNYIKIIIIIIIKYNNVNKIKNKYFQ